MKNSIQIEDASHGTIWRSIWLCSLQLTTTYMWSCRNLSYRKIQVWRCTPWSISSYKISDLCHQNTKGPMKRQFARQRNKFTWQVSMRLIICRRPVQICTRFTLPVPSPQYDLRNLYTWIGCRKDRFLRSHILNSFWKWKIWTHHLR